MTLHPLRVHLDGMDLARQLRHDARVGLTSRPRWLPPKWFYDEWGGELFERITRLPEYYPTRAERAVLVARAELIARTTEMETLIELGSGSSEKTRLLLDAGTRHGTLGTFAPLDVSASALTSATRRVAEAYPGLRVCGVVGDFTRHLDRLPTGGRRLMAFLGGTIGNLLPDERAGFLRATRAALGPGDWLLLGADLVKEPARLLAAYDDAAGVTAEFNRNVLRVLNRELAADFDPEAFTHVAYWDADREWIEMRLRARRVQRIHLAALDLTVTFDEGEELRTEVSAKFRPDGLARELAEARFTTTHRWFDPEGLFMVLLARAG